MTAEGDLERARMVADTGPPDGLAERIAIAILDARTEGITEERRTWVRIFGDLANHLDALTHHTCADEIRRTLTNGAPPA